MRKTMCAIVAVLALTACGSPAPKTFAEKCQAIGGTYNTAAKTCVFQAE